MQKPTEPKRLYPPSSCAYEERQEKEYIYSYTASLMDEDNYEDEDAQPWDTTSKNVKPIEEVDLGWLFTQIPEGLNPSDIKIECDFNANSMSYNYHYVRFYYNRTIPARMGEYKTLLAQYKKYIKQYEKDKVQYEADLKKWEIHEAEQKLAQLKGQQSE